MTRGSGEPRRLTRRMVLAIHDEAVAMFGGTAGVRHDGLLESAYESEATLFDLAASLCQGICKNRPFLDGNKRTALLSARAFLFLNGLAFEPREVDEVEHMVALAAGELGETELAAWFEEFSSPVKPSRK